MSSTRSTSSHRPPGLVTFLGAGPGDPDLVTVRALSRLSVADLVLHDGDVCPELLERCREDAELVIADGTVASRVKAIVAAVRNGRQVARLVSGDPLLTGQVIDELAGCARAQLPFELVPGLTAALAVPAYAGVPLGAGSRELRIVRLDANPDWAGLATGSATRVLLGTADQLLTAAERLTQSGMSVTTPVAVTSGGTTVAQRTVVSVLGELGAVLDPAELPGPCVAVVGAVVEERERYSWFETKQLFGWQILVPRTREQAATLSERLRGYGAVPVEVPTIAVEPPRTPAAMDRAVKGIASGRYQWVAFTSLNAVRAIREKFEAMGLDVRALAGIKIAAVGEQTAAVLREWGADPELVAPAERQNSEGLLSVWPRYDDVFDPIDRVLLPRADIATDTLVAGLIERGWQVDDVTAYRTVRAAPPSAEIRDAIKGGGFDAVLFTSSSTVRNLVGIAGKPHPSTVIAVIGPQTAKTAEEHGLRIDVLSPEPSVDALAEALADYGAARRLAGESGRPGARSPKPVKPLKGAR